MVTFYKKKRLGYRHTQNFSKDMGNEKTVIYKPGIEASEEINHANTLISET